MIHNFPVDLIVKKYQKLLNKLISISLSTFLPWLRHCITFFLIPISFESVPQIRNILVRIRIRGSIPLTNGSGSDYGSVTCTNGSGSGRQKHTDPEGCFESLKF